MIKVKKGQDPYSVIGQYIRDHVSAIEDMIAVIEIDGETSNELFMVDMTVDGYFIWESDWYEGEENVVLIDFFPVSDACNPKHEKEPKMKPVFSSDGYADGNPVYDFATCPRCEYQYEDTDKAWGEPFCPRCGAAIDWSEVLR